MQVCIVAVLVLAVCIQSINGQEERVTVVSEEDKNRMSNDIWHLMETSFDSDGQRFLVAGMIRMCFHDCVVICDGCIDTRRKVQGGNNGLIPTWLPLKRLAKKYEKVCSRADFFALACAVTSDYAAKRGEDEGLCVPTPGLDKNDCRPNMKILWGRRTCHVPQLVEPIRNIPDGNANPYEWFEKNMGMTARQAVCIMGSHSLGKLRSNETGFSGPYTSRFDVLSNEFFIMMAHGTGWKQKEKKVVVDERPQTRFQWEAEEGNGTRVNADMMLMYRLGKLGAHGKSDCLIGPLRSKRKHLRCKRMPGWEIVQEMAADNKAFLECFGDAMDKMVHNGYEEGELVPTGQVIPAPPPTTTTERPQTTRPFRPPRRGGGGRRRKGKRRRGNRSSKKQRNRLRDAQAATPAPVPPPAPVPVTTQRLGLIDTILG